MAATVVLDGGGVGVWQGVAGPSGWSVAPCASGASSHWSFAQGSTRTGDSLGRRPLQPRRRPTPWPSITLYTSTAGVVAPAAYQGMSVPAGRLEVANVSDHVQNDPAVAAVVSTLSGSVVAAERQVTQAVGLSLVAGNARGDDDLRLRLQHRPHRRHGDVPAPRPDGDPRTGRRVGRPPAWRGRADLC